MAELFGCKSDNIGVHLRNIYDDNELSKNRTTEEISVVQKEGNRAVSRKIEYYNLDAIIAVGYRVNSKKATQFRIWATKVLKEYMIKGFVIDKEKITIPASVKIIGMDAFHTCKNLKGSSLRTTTWSIWLSLW